MSKPTNFIEWVLFIIKLLIAIMPYAKDLVLVFSDAFDDYELTKDAK